MLLLDTNIVSETMRPHPDAAVMAWLAEQPVETVHLSTISIAEIHFGLELLADDGRQRELRRRFDRFVSQGFMSRLLDFDRAAAVRYGAIQASRRNAGRPMSVPDAQIAAVAQAHDLVLVTRNGKDFDGLDLALVNPFDFDPT